MLVYTILGYVLVGIYPHYNSFISAAEPPKECRIERPNLTTISNSSVTADFFWIDWLMTKFDILN
jgi:hypothetical protein